MSCAENGFTIVVPRYGLEGKVYISTPGVRSSWGWNAQEKTLRSPDGKRLLASLDRIVVKMQIDYAKPYEPRIVFSSVDPPAGPGTGEAKIGHALPLEPPSQTEAENNEENNGDKMDVESRAAQGSKKNPKKRKGNPGSERDGRKVQKTKE